MSATARFARAPRLDPMRLILNGRFLFRPVTGVERLALELGRAIADVVAALPAPAPTLVVATPAGADDAVTRLALPGVASVSVGKRSGQAWEQLDLARVDPRAWLLDLCNLGPVTRRRQALVVCDAQIYRQPRSYARAFRMWYRLVTPILGRRAAALFTISHHSQRELEAVGAFPKGRSHVLRLGVDHVDRVRPDPSVLARHALAPGRYLLAIGSLAPHKNLRTLIAAFLQANIDPSIPLVIAGGGNGRVFAGAGLSVDPRIRYLGRVDDGELRALYDAAMAFASPAFTEGFGLTPLEAMACGCPVIATTGGAVPEVCGQAAVYADPTSVDSWSQAIATVAGDRALRDRMAAASRAHAASFRWKLTAIDLLAVLADHDRDATLAGHLRRLREEATHAADNVIDDPDDKDDR